MNTHDFVTTFISVMTYFAVLRIAHELRRANDRAEGKK